MARFTGKTVLVTGAGRGLGETIAEEFAKEGANVVVVDIDEATANATRQKVADLGAEAIAVAADVSVRSDVEKMVSETSEAFGQLDIAVNNAGIEHTPTPFSELTDETFDKVVGVNYRGLWLSMQAEINAMLSCSPERENSPEREKKEKGVIVNITSVAAHVGTPLMSIYGSSKHAAIGLTKSAALEYCQQGIRINSVSPGGILTPMLAHVAETNPEYIEQGNTAHPIGRIASTKEIADGVLYAASDEASFMVGHALVIDGGYTAA